MGLIGIFKGIVIGILSFILIMSIPSLLIGMSIRDNALNASFYQDILDKQNAYSIMKDAILSSMTENIDLPPGVPLKQTDLKAELNKSIPDSWVKKEVDGLIENFLAYIKNETDQLDLTISFKEIKPNLVNAYMNIAAKVATTGERVGTQIGQFPEGYTGPGGCKDLLECKIYCEEPNNMPECEATLFPPTMARSLGLNCTTYGECLSYCDDPAHAEECKTAQAVISQMYAEQMIKQTAAIGEIGAIAGIPDEIDFGAEMMKDKESMEMFEKIREGIQTMYWVLDKALLAVIVIIILIAVISFSVKGAFRSISIPLIIAGIVAYAIAFGVPKIVETMIPQMMGEGAQVGMEAGTGTGADIGAGFGSLIQSIIPEILNGIFAQVKSQAIFIISVGVVLLILSFVFGIAFSKRKWKRKK